MKFLVLTALGVASLFAGGNLYAQQVLEATIPFDFNVGQAAMPAGHYMVTLWSDSVLLVRHRANGTGAFAPIYLNGMSQEDQKALVFHKYVGASESERYFLSEVRGLSGAGGVGLRPCALENELQGTVRTFETVEFPEPAGPPPAK